MLWKQSVISGWVFASTNCNSCSFTYCGTTSSSSSGSHRSSFSIAVRSCLTRRMDTFSVHQAVNFLPGKHCQQPLGSLGLLGIDFLIDFYMQDVLIKNIKAKSA
ncbi:MAG: hypothetical protein JRJ72_05135 [Deltaproteobacteria bacterium]|nr:hypothetical protein [Deltaproteobacteria bacterium]